MDVLLAIQALENNCKKDAAAVICGMLGHDPNQR
jgi:hypothetical protein